MQLPIIVLCILHGAASLSTPPLSSVTDTRTPVTILSGFLGAGKTTLLKHALENKEELKVGAVVNDLAAVNIDAKLVRDTTGDTADPRTSRAANPDTFVELQNGCMCCTVADELFSSIAQLVSMHELRNGPGADYDHIVIESSGVSEPRAVRDNFQDAEADGMMLFDRVRLDTLVTVVDADAFLDAYTSRSVMSERLDLAEESALAAAENGALLAALYGQEDGSGGRITGQRAVVDLLVEQVECADVIVVNKVDLVEPNRMDTLRSIIGALNPTGTVHECAFGELDLEQTLGAGRAQGAANFGIVDEHKIAVSVARDARNQKEGAKNGEGSDGLRSGDHGAQGLEGEHREHSHEPSHEHSHEPSHEHSHESSHEHSHESSHEHSHEPSHEHSHEHSHDHSHGGMGTGEACLEPECNDPTHDHSHSHDHSPSSTAGDRFGISSFVYAARRPFKPSRLAKVIQSLPTAEQADSGGGGVGGGGPYSLRTAMLGLLRSKGFVWLASSPSSAFYWSHAGSHYETQVIGRWWATVDESLLPDWQRDSILTDFEGEDGDRRQEIVFIGTGLQDESNQKTIIGALDWCLLTDREMAHYRTVQDDAPKCAAAFVNPLQVRKATP